MVEKHELMDGRLHVYKRDNSRYWQCSTYIAGKNRRTTTKEESLAHAKDFAEDWYFGLRGRAKNGELKAGKPFKLAAEQFLTEFEALTVGQRSPKYIKVQADRVRTHLIPFLEGCSVADVTPAKVQEYRLHRANNRWTGKPYAICSG